MIRISALALIIAALSVSVASAQEKVSIVEAIDASGNIRINQPQALLRLLEYVPAQIVSDDETSSSHGRPHQATNTRTGYRVQVFDDNNPRTARSQAEAAHNRISAEFPHLRSYLSFNSPYWRVKVGDFRTRAEAEAAMAEIRQAMPGLGAYLRVVRDKINIYE